MASYSEVGHAKNIANYSSLIQILQEMGEMYNPTNPNIQLPNLIPLQTELVTAIENLNTAKTNYSNAVAQRETAIEPLGKLATKIKNSFFAINVTQAEKENVDSIVKKIRGDQRPINSTNTDTQESTTISTSQMSYDNRIANLNTLITILTSHPEYAPNEEELQTANLLTYQQELVTLSQAVNNTGNALITARNNRNKPLYTNPINVIQLVKDIKYYLKSLGSEAKSYYDAATDLKFVNKT